MRFQPENNSDGTRSNPAIVKVQNQEEGRIAQLNIKRAVNASGTKLLRRLSKIFHFDNNEIGLRCSWLFLPGAHGRNQLPICQSPRIQRCLLLTSALYREGKSS